VLRKRKKEYLYSAILVCHTHKALRHGSHSLMCKLHHACVFFISVDQMSPPLTEVADIQLQLTTYRPQRDERLTWPGLLTYSRQFTHISGHLSATGRAQDREVRRPKSNVLPLCHAANLTYCLNDLSGFIL